MENLIESSYLPPPHPPLWRVGETSAVNFFKLSGLIAQLIKAPSYDIDGHVFDSSLILFHFPMYLYVFVCILNGKKD